MVQSERIFINYRRADTRWAAARLYDGLVQLLGTDRLFMDVDSIPPGADFVEYLNEYVDRSKAIVVLIGPHWLDGINDSGVRRVDDPDDFVNIEISRALARNVSVIPVLVDGARMPTETQLPDNLSGLARRQAVRLGHETYRQDIERLSRALTGPARTKDPHRGMPERRKAGRRKNDRNPLIIAAGSALITCVVIALAWAGFHIVHNTDASRKGPHAAAKGPPE